MLAQCVRQRDLILLVRFGTSSERREDAGTFAVIVGQRVVIRIRDIQRSDVFEQCILQPSGFPELKALFRQRCRP